MSTSSYKTKAIVVTVIAVAFVLSAMLSRYNDKVRDGALAKAGAQEFLYWPVWAEQWHKVAICLNVPERSLDSVHWIELRSGERIPAALGGTINTRAIWLKPDTLVFMAGGYADDALRAHELVHYAEQVDDHPRKWFDGRCGVLPADAQFLSGN